MVSDAPLVYLNPTPDHLPRPDPRPGQLPSTDTWDNLPMPDHRRGILSCMPMESWYTPKSASWPMANPSFAPRTSGSSCCKGIVHRSHWCIRVPFKHGYHRSPTTWTYIDSGAICLTLEIWTTGIVSNKAWKFITSCFQPTIPIRISASGKNRFLCTYPTSMQKIHPTRQTQQPMTSVPQCF